MFALPRSFPGVLRHFRTSKARLPALRAFTSTYAPPDPRVAQMRIASSVSDPRLAAVDALPITGVKTAGDILARKATGDLSLCSISGTSTIAQGIHMMVSYNMGCLLVTRADSAIGIVSKKDILQAIDRFGDAALKIPLSEIDVPLNRIVHVSPNTPVKDCAVLMVESKIHHLPVYDRREGTIKGIVNVRDVVWAPYASEMGGKESAIRHTIGSRGIGAEAVPIPLAQNKPVLSVATGEAAIANPQKISGNSEDSLFVWKDPTWNGGNPVTFVGIADGVGSWAKFGVDAGEFARSVMTQSQAFIAAARAGNEEIPGPADVIRAAWGETVDKNIVGSSTALVAYIDSVRNQLVAANIGDCGLMILRRGLPSQSGTLSQRDAIGVSGWHTAYRSVQQLHDFNRPYQLGFAPGHNQRFETPDQCHPMRVPLLKDDVIVFASDGLYDNVFESDILQIVQKWTKDMVGNSDRAITAGEARILADLLVDAARQASWNRWKESPFSILAKENDILWSGGRPDDVSVVVAVVS